MSSGMGWPRAFKRVPPQLPRDDCRGRSPSGRWRPHKRMRFTASLDGMAPCSPRHTQVPGAEPRSSRWPPKRPCAGLGLQVISRRARRVIIRCTSTTCSLRARAILQLTRLSSQVAGENLEQLDRAAKVDHVDQRWPWGVILAGILHRAWAILPLRCLPADRGSPVLPTFVILWA